MAGDGDRNKSLKEALIDSLTAILSPLHDVRVNGEEQIKALEVTEGACHFLILFLSLSFVKQNMIHYIRNSSLSPLYFYIKLEKSFECHFIHYF